MLPDHLRWKPDNRHSRRGRAACGRQTRAGDRDSRRRDDGGSDAMLSPPSGSHHGASVVRSADRGIFSESALMDETADDPDVAPLLNPHNDPCQCCGAPINCIWLSPTAKFLLDYACGRCGHQWPHDPLLVHRAIDSAKRADADEHPIKVPGIAGLRPPPAQPPGEFGHRTSGTMPNAFVGHHDATFGQDQLDGAQAEAEDVIQPNGMADDLRRKPVPGIGALRFHAGRLALLPRKRQIRSYCNVPMS